MNPSRLVRVFISSTFRDFIEERDLLVKEVFPRLRRQFRDRFVEISEVDLRWGVTRKQSETGEALTICLREIDRCRPTVPVFFVGLLGERYGWVPQESDIKAFSLTGPVTPWLRKQVASQTSATEMEVLYGVLGKKEMRDKAFFYFRKDGYQNRYWREIAKRHRAMKPPVAVCREDFDNSGSKRGKDVDDRKQSVLKQAIRDASLRWDPRGYETPGEMAEMVFEDLSDAIAREFPVETVRSETERRRLEHEAFGASNASGYVPRLGLFTKLDDAFEAGPDVCVVSGESGAGKSALLASWLNHLGDRTPRRRFVHYIGGTPESTTSRGIVFRLMEEIRSWGDITDPVPPTMDEAVELLPSWLERSAGEGILIVLDALDQLETPDDRALRWLPARLPDRVHLVVSTLQGDTEDRLRGRGWMRRIVKVPPLSQRERRAIIEKFLGASGKDLASLPVRRLASAPQCANPLFLRAVLNELKARASFHNLAPLLDKLLRARDPEELFAQILTHLEEYDRARPKLVRDAMGYLAVARRGLTEGELLQLLSTHPSPDTRPLPRRYWSPVFLALADSFVNRDGQLSFFHDYLRQSVKRKYLRDKGASRRAHARLGDTVLAWATQRFSPSLRDYGFQHGIFHLLAGGKRGEAVRLLLAEGFCQAQREFDPTLQAHSAALRSAIEDLASHPAVTPIAQDRHLAALIEKEARAADQRSGITAKQLARMADPTCPEVHLRDVELVCGPLQPGEVEGAVLIATEAICRSKLARASKIGCITAWVTYLERHSPCLDCSGTYGDSRVLAFLERHRDLLSPEDSMRIGGRRVHDELVKRMLERGDADSAFRVLQSSDFGGIASNFIVPLARCSRWDLAFAMVDRLEESAASGLGHLDRLASEAFDANRPDELRLARAHFLAAMAGLGNDDHSRPYYHARGAAILAKCGDTVGAREQLVMAFGCVRGGSSDLKILRALRDVAHLPDGTVLTSLAERRLLDRRGGAGDPQMLSVLEDIGLTGRAVALAGPHLQAFLASPNSVAKCRQCFGILAKAGRNLDEDLVTRWCHAALCLADAVARNLPKSRKRRETLLGEVEFIASLGDCLLDIGRLEGASYTAQLLEKALEPEEEGFYCASLYGMCKVEGILMPINAVVFGWAESIRKRVEAGLPAEAQSAPVPEETDPGIRALDDLFSALERGDLRSAIEIWSAPPARSETAEEREYGDLREELLGTLGKAIRGDRGDELKTALQQTVARLRAFVGETGLEGNPDPRARELIKYQLAAEELLKFRCSKRISPELLQGDAGIEFDAIVVADLLGGRNCIIGVYEGIDRAIALVDAADICCQVGHYTPVDDWLAEAAKLLSSPAARRPARSNADWERREKAENCRDLAARIAIRLLPITSVSAQALALLFRGRDRSEEERALAEWLRGDFEKLAARVQQSAEIAHFVASLLKYCEAAPRILFRSLAAREEIRRGNSEWLVARLNGSRRSRTHQKSSPRKRRA